MRSSILLPSLLWAVVQVVEYEHPTSYSKCFEVNTVHTIPGCGCEPTTITTAPCCIQTVFTVTSTSTVTATTTEIDVTTVAPAPPSTPTVSSTEIFTSTSSIESSIPSPVETPSSTSTSTCEPTEAPGTVDYPFCLECCEMEQAEEGDSCEELAAEAEISVDYFQSINPAVFCGLSDEPTKKKRAIPDEFGITAGNYYCVAGTPNKDTCSAEEVGGSCNGIDHCLCGVDIDGYNVCYYDPAQWGPYIGGHGSWQSGSRKRQVVGGIQSAIAGIGNVIQGAANADIQPTPTHINGPPVAPTSVDVSAGGNSNSGYVTIDINGQHVLAFDYSPWACTFTSDCKQDNRYWTEDLSCVLTGVYPAPICVDTRACLKHAILQQGTNSWTMDLGYGQNSFGLAAYGYNATVPT